MDYEGQLVEDWESGSNVRRLAEELNTQVIRSKLEDANTA